MRELPGCLLVSMRLCLILTATSSVAEVRLPRLLGDGVILQRDRPTSVWGWADEGEVIEVYLDDTLVGSTTAADGKWQLEIAAQSAGGPHQIIVTGNNSLAIDDMYFGDIWIASGQSNMELSVERVQEKYEQDIATANYPLIREFDVPRKFDFRKPLDDLDGGSWKATTPDSVLSFSAVGYFFAKSVHEHFGVPIGIISSNYGGSTAEGWMSEQALEAYPHHLSIAKSYRDDEYLQGLMDNEQAIVDAWTANVDNNDAGLQEKPGWMAVEYDDSDWQTMNLPAYWANTNLGPVNGVVWFRKTIDLPASAIGEPAKLMLGRIIDADTAYVNGVEVGNVTYQYPPRRYDIATGILKPGTNTIVVRVVSNVGEGGFVPDKPYWLNVGNTTVDLKGNWRMKVGAASEPIRPPKFVRYLQPLGLYNAMLAPLQKMRIKGVVWYQGESNVNAADEYIELFPAMIRDWRHGWHQGDFPFVFVQLANFLEIKEQPVESSWSELREAQRLALRVPNTAMAVAIDLGEWNDLHPLNKKAVGERLALAARSIAYGETDLVSSGPAFRSVDLRGDELRLQFEHTGAGLVARGGPLQGFAIAGADGVFHWASATIDGEAVIVRSADVKQPKYVRYAWADNPRFANLYNAEGLPASPFQAETENQRSGVNCGKKYSLLLRQLATLTALLHHSLGANVHSK